MKQFLCMVTERDRVFKPAEILDIMRAFASETNYRFTVKGPVGEDHTLHAYEVRYGFTDISRALSNIYVKHGLTTCFIYLPDSDKKAIGMKSKEFNLGLNAYSHVRAWPELNS